MKPYFKYGLPALLLFVSTTSYAADTLKLRYITSALADNKGAPLKSPEGVACGDTDLIVADTDNGRLVRYSYQDKNLKGGDEIKVSQAPFPSRLQSGSKGDIFVLDGRSRKIVHLNSGGAFVGNIEPQGLSSPANYSVKSFKVDAGDNIWLLDIFGERVLKLDQTGKLLSQIPFPKNSGFMTDVAVTQGGDLLLLDSVRSTIYIAKKDSNVFAPLTKSMSGYMNFAGYMSTSAGSADIFLLDQDGGAVVIIGPDGSFKGRQLSLGWKPGLLYYPTQICMNRKGDVFIADRNNCRVQIFENVK